MDLVVYKLDNNFIYTTFIKTTNTTLMYTNMDQWGALGVCNWLAHMFLANSCYISFFRRSPVDRLWHRRFSQ